MPLASSKTKASPAPQFKSSYVKDLLQEQGFQPVSPSPSLYTKRTPLSRVTTAQTRSVPLKSEPFVPYYKRGSRSRSPENVADFPNGILSPLHTEAELHQSPPRSPPRAASPPRSPPRAASPPRAKPGPVVRMRRPIVNSVPGKIKRPEVELAPPPALSVATDLNLYRYPPMQRSTALKVMCWNVKYNPKIPTPPKKNDAFNAYVHQHRPDAVFVQEAPDVFLEGYTKLQDDTVGAATVFLKAGRFSILGSRTVESVSNDKRFPVRPTLLVEVEDEVTRKPMVLGSAWVGHHITQENWDKYVQDIGVFPGVDVIIGGDFNDAVQLQKGAVAMAELGRVETPGNTCCADNMAFKGDVFFTNASGQAENLPYRKDISDHGPILGHFETASAELTEYFAHVSESGHRQPRAALEHLLPTLPAYVENDFRRAVPGAFKAFEFNPHLTQERVDAFCRKWGADLRHKVIVAYHGTSKYVTSLILKSNLRKGSINAYGVGAYLATQLYTPMHYVTKIVRGEVNELLGCLVVVNRDTVHNVASVDPVTGFVSERPESYVVVKPGEHPDDSLDAILPLFVIKFVEPQLRKVVDPRAPVEKIDGIPFAVPPASREAMLFGGIRTGPNTKTKGFRKKRRRTRSRR